MKLFILSLIFLGSSVQAVQVDRNALCFNRAMNIAQSVALTTLSEGAGSDYGGMDLARTSGSMIAKSGTGDFQNYTFRFEFYEKSTDPLHCAYTVKTYSISPTTCSIVSLEEESCSN